MAQNIANNLRMRARVNLPRRVAVSKHMGTDLRGDITRAPSIEADPMAYRAGCEFAMGQRL